MTKVVDVEEIIERLSKLSYEEVLAYWIEGEKEEAELYKELVERAKALGLGEDIVKVFEKLSEESRKHAEELTRIFRESFSKEPETDIPQWRFSQFWESSRGPTR